MTAGSDPFSQEALDGARVNLITDRAEREAVATQVAALERLGYVILPDVLVGDDLERVRNALDRINADTRFGIYEFEGERTRRAYNVVSRTRAFDPMITDRSVLAIIESYFGEAPQLSASMGMTIHEGQQAQPLHRDTGHYSLPWPRPPLEVNALWALDDFHEANGATRMIPGSHRIPDEERPRTSPETVTMGAGSVLVYDGALWHGGGASTTPAPRRAINHIYARQWLRQQDNMYLQFDTDVVLGLPESMQRLLGYWIYGYTLGVVDGQAPLQVLRARRGAGPPSPLG